MLGIGFEAGTVATRLVEDLGNVRRFMRWHAEHLLEGVDLVAGNDTVRFCHFRAQHDDADREGDRFGRVAFAFLALRGAVTVHRMSGDGADQRAQRPCAGEPGCAP